MWIGLSNTALEQHTHLTHNPLTHTRTITTAANAASLCKLLDTGHTHFTHFTHSLTTSLPHSHHATHSLSLTHRSLTHSLHATHSPRHSPTAHSVTDIAPLTLLSHSLNPHSTRQLRSIQTQRETDQGSHSARGRVGSGRRPPPGGTRVSRLSVGRRRRKRVCSHCHASRGRRAPYLCRGHCS